MNIKILRSARRTIVDGIRFYESQEAGLGAYFLNSVMSDLRSLSIYAGIHQRFNNSYYRMTCTIFPYSIYYKKQGQEVSVYAILDDRRDSERAEKFLDNIRLPSEENNY